MKRARHSNPRVDWATLIERELAVLLERSLRQRFAFEPLGAQRRGVTGPSRWSSRLIQIVAPGASLAGRSKS